jgi:hypothetical protein
VSRFELHPKHHYDREEEKDLFKDLLQLADDARVLTIRGRGGMGKSSLLKWFAYHCLWSDDVLACSLTSLSENTDHTPYGLISTIRSEPLFEKLRFARYDELDRARTDSDFRPFRSRGSASGVANTGQVFGGVVAGVAERVVAGNVQNYNEAPRTWTSAQESTARRVLVDAFFEDLGELTSEKAIVIMLDAFEQCHDPLRSWVRDRLLREHVFGKEERCHGLIVVLAGHDLPEISELPEHVHSRYVRSIDSLSTLEAEQVSDFLRLYQFEPTEKVLEFIQQALALGVTILAALQIASDVEPQRP